jgi:hypothetical protein
MGGEVIILTVRFLENTNVRQHKFIEMASHIVYLADVQMVEDSST